MQDKEFDDLFRSKLDDLEAEPSAGVWTGIESGLASGNRKKYLLPLLSIAASLLILVTAGVLFIPHGVKQNQSPNKIAKTVHLQNSIPAAKSDATSAVQKPGISNKSKNTALAVNKTYRSSPVKVIARKQVDIAPIVNDEADLPIKTDNQNVLATIQPNKQDVIKPVVPDESTPLVAKQLTDEPAITISKPVLATAQLPAAKQFAMPSKQKHRIRSLGDFINVVVAKVDKRQDKIIEFTNTDDDESMITGVNLGIIKLKKDK